MLTNCFNVNVGFYTDTDEPRKLKYSLTIEDENEIPKVVRDRIKASLREIIDEFLEKAETNF